jgi:hypothetical protein
VAKIYPGGGVEDALVFSESQIGRKTTRNSRNDDLRRTIP